MATARKTQVDPLVEELPPAPEPRPTQATDVGFTVEIAPYIVGGSTFFRWTITDNTHNGYAGDYTGHTESGFPTAEKAETGAAEYVERVRHAVQLKLDVPDSYTITL